GPAAVVAAGQWHNGGAHRQLQAVCLFRQYCRSYGQIQGHHGRCHHRQGDRHRSGSRQLHRARDHGGSAQRGHPARRLHGFDPDRGVAGREVHRHQRRRRRRSAGRWRRDSRHPVFAGAGRADRQVPAQYREQRMRIFDMMTALRRGLLVLLACVPLFAQAAPSAHEVIQQTTDQLLADLKTNKERYRQDPSAFYDALNGILGPVVDAEGISRSIMTVRYSRNATPEQMNRFQENFKRSLMQFYGNALLEYNNQQIRVLPPSGKQDPERTSVGMEVTGRQGEIYPVSYTMTNNDGEWRVRNVIINGINIGKLFRDQFADAMQKNGGDLDKTIDGWAEVVARAKDTQAGQQAVGDE